LSEINFQELCDFNICEEDKDLGEYRARFLSRYKFDLNDPEENNWIYREPIRKKFLEIIDKRREEFDAPDEYDYSAEIIITYQIIDKSSNHLSGEMEHHINKKSENKENFIKNVELIAEELDRTFKEHLIIMYKFKVYRVILSCNFYVK